MLENKGLGSDEPPPGGVALVGAALVPLDGAEIAPAGTILALHRLAGWASTINPDAWEVREARRLLVLAGEA